jgi:hypothetical protein
MNASLPINAPDDDALLARAEALAWRDDGASLPAVLMRPSLDGAVGRLDYSEPEDPKSPAWPRWKIDGLGARGDHGAKTVRRGFQLWRQASTRSRFRRRSARSMNSCCSCTASRWR